MDEREREREKAKTEKKSQLINAECEEVSSGGRLLVFFVPGFLFI